jgi:hypothetical protein
MYEGGGSTPCHHQPQGGGYPPMPSRFAPVFPHLRVELTTERRKFRPVSDRGVPPTRVDQVTPSPPCSGPGAYPPCPFHPWGVGVATPPLRLCPSDGGFIAATFVSRAKGGVPPPSYAMGGTPLSQKLMTPLPPFKFFLRQEGVATPQGARVGVPPFHFHLSGINR